MTTNPGLANQVGVRRALRWVGLPLLVLGVALVAYGFIGFASGVFGAGTDPMAGGPQHMGRYFASFAGGGFLAVAGLALVGAGFQGALARYGAGETLPVVKDGVDYLTDGEGLLGVGRSVDDVPAAYCEKCGARLGAEAKFCKGCGAAL